MTLKRKLSFYVVLFLLLAAGMGAVLVLGARQERAFFHDGRRLLQVQQVLRESEYFLHRHNRAMLSYVMLLEDAEKLQVMQTEKSLLNRLELWGEWARQGWVPAGHLAAVEAERRRMAFIRFQVLNLVEQGLRREAIEKVRTDFWTASARADGRIKAAAAHLDARNRLLVEDLSRVVDRSHAVFAGGMCLAFLLALLLAWNLSRSMIFPVMSHPGGRGAPAYRGSSAFERRRETRELEKF